MPAAAFVDRVAELDRLVRDLAAGQKVFLISPRRYGKSSLIRRALAAMSRRGALTVEVTVSSFSSYVAFLEGYARALAAAETKWDRARSWLRDAISSTRVDVSADAPGRRRPVAATASMRVSFPNARTDRDISRLAQEVFALPARLAETRRRKVVVALDEFQAIGGFNGGSVEHALRAAVQHQREVGYVFAGSEPSLMERMLSPKRPFYKAGPVMRLEKIPADEFAAFIDARFTRVGHAAGSRAWARRSSSWPATCPTTCSGWRTKPGTRCAAAPRRRATLDDLHQALRRLLAEQQTMFEAVWQRLTLAQRAVLRAVVLEDGRELLSADVRARHRLGGPSTVQAALAALMRDDVVTREVGSLRRRRFAAARVGRAADVLRRCRTRQLGVCGGIERLHELRRRC